VVNGGRHGDSDRRMESSRLYRPAAAALPEPYTMTAGRRARGADDTADAVRLLHQPEALVDVVEREAMRQERLDVDLAREPAVDQERHLGARLHAAERRARDATARDQEARYDLEHLALARDAAHRREPPGLAGG